MQKSGVGKLFLLLFLFLSFTNFQCNKDDVATAFCAVGRPVYKTVNNEAGTIVYFDRYNRWAINFKVDIPNNIDTQIIGLLCDLEPAFKKTGLTVKVSGVLKNFNSEEGIKPNIGGQELYFFEPSQITIQ